MEIKFLRFTVIIILTLCVGCTDGNHVASSSNQLGEIVPEAKVQVDSEFGEFINDFTEVELPLKVSVPCRDTLIKTRDNEIERELAIKYLCQGDSNRLNQPSGGIFQYYYGYKLAGPGDLISLIYLRPSYNHYSGFILATFDLEGVLIDELFLAGILGEEGQKESMIEENFHVSQEEISYAFSGVGDYETIPCKVIERKLKILPEGRIEKMSEKAETYEKCILEDDCGYISKP